jgi:hypothetical protein
LWGIPLRRGPTKRCFGELTIAATAAPIADPMKDATTSPGTTGVDEIQERKTGVLDATRDRHVATAAAFGMIAVRDLNDTSHRLVAGRLFQRARARSNR